MGRLRRGRARLEKLSDAVEVHTPPEEDAQNRWNKPAAAYHERTTASRTHSLLAYQPSGPKPAGHQAREIGSTSPAQASKCW